MLGCDPFMTDSEVAAANQSFYTVKKHKSPDYSMTIAVAFDVMNIKKAVKCDEFSQK